MNIRVLGSSGSELPGQNLPAFLLDDFMLLDGGTICRVLDRKAQSKISDILITHAHLDHIAGIPFFVDNMYINGFDRNVIITSGRDVLNDIRENILNNRIWPDFSTIQNSDHPVLKYRNITTGKCLKIRHLEIYAEKVNHSVSSYGYILTDPDRNSLIYTGDTGPAESLWKKANTLKHKVKALIVEVTLPNAMSELAAVTGHLTPSFLAEEIEKLSKLPEKIYISHIKPYHRKQIENELSMLKGLPIEILSDNDVFSL